MSLDEFAENLNTYLKFSYTKIRNLISFLNDKCHHLKDFFYYGDSCSNFESIYLNGNISVKGLRVEVLSLYIVLKDLMYCMSYYFQIIH